MTGGAVVLGCTGGRKTGGGGRKLMPIPGGRSIEEAVGGGAKDGSLTGGGAGTGKFMGMEEGSGVAATDGGKGTVADV